MTAECGPSGRLSDALVAPGTSSFSEFLRTTAPNLLPWARPLPAHSAGEVAPHGTTVVALAAVGGVVMAGDRRATMGNLIASRELQKVYEADPYSLVGIAGTAGVGIELVRLYQVELEHYEKMEGVPLSIEGKSNRLATLVRNNLAAAMQGLGVLPIYAGFDLDASDPARAGRIFSLDLAGGLYERTGFDGIGSGSLFAKAALKKRYQAGLSIDEAVRLAVESLYDAADDDSATGGPDVTRKIYPIVMTATAQGTHRLSDSEAADIAEAVVRARRENPGG